MKITTCYTVPIKYQVYNARDPASACKGNVDGRLMKTTSGICLAALKWCTDTFLAEWDYLSTLPASQKPGIVSRKRGADILIHSTKGSTAKYPAFDDRFPYFPAYMRRAVIADALGMVSSYVSNHRNWEALKPSERGNEPALGLPTRYEITFYDQERDLSSLDKGVIRLKLYDGMSWGWHSFQISVSDARYVSRMKASRKMLSPVVEKVRGRYRIRFSFSEEKDLVEENPLGYRVLAVDLGINSPAAWCVMEPDGTVYAKGAVHLPCEEDRLNHLINRKRMYQQAGKKPRGIYRMVGAANRSLAISTAKEIIRLAVLYDTDCIVFEHLDRNGSAKGRKYRERIHLWRANDVQARVGIQVHRYGMRISRVCAWGTSRLAFDGSGTVTRDSGNHTLCTFQNGKRYNCDISAAMNIGARFFLREYAEGCPGMVKTPQRTYSTLVGFIKTATA